MNRVFHSIEKYFEATKVKLGHSIYRKVPYLEAMIYGFAKNNINIGELNICFYESKRSSNKPTLLMLHGYSADKDVWPRFARHLVNDYHVIIPDMAGHGETGFRSNWNYSATQQAKYLVAFLDSLGIKQVHIIGNSMGGFISAHFAKAYPERTLSATLIDPAGVNSPEPSDMGKMLETGCNPFLIHNQRQFYEFYAMTMANPPWLPKFVITAIGETYQQRRSQLLRIFQDFYEVDMLDDQLDEISPPVFLLWGDKDQLIHVSSVSVWEAGISNIRVNIRKNIGHMPMVEAPKETAILYRNFLADLN